MSPEFLQRMADLRRHADGKPLSEESASVLIRFGFIDKDSRAITGLGMEALRDRAWRRVHVK